MSLARMEATGVALAMLLALPAATACHALVEEAYAAGSRDNISAIVIEPLAATERASAASSLAFSAFSAVARIMLDICSSEVLVSSTEAACSLAPEARVWLAIDTCRAAEAVWSAPRSACATGCEGQRRPIESCSPAAAAPTPARRGRITVTGPGQNASISFCAKAGTLAA